MIEDFPPLETDRLRLRAPVADDLDFFFRHFSDPHVNRHLLDAAPISTPAEAREILDSYTSPAGQSHNRWVLVLKSEERPVGTCGFHHWSRAHRRAEIGYDLGSAWWRKGLMTEALEAVLAHGFGGMELHRVQALVHPDNEASLRLLAGLGFRREAMLRDYFLHGGRFHDHAQLSLLAPDWTARAKRG